MSTQPELPQISPLCCIEMRIVAPIHFETIHMSLTDLEIRRAKPAEKTYTKSDGNGLPLQI